MSNYKSSILQLLAELGGTAPTDIVLSDAQWKAAVLTMLGEIADGGGGGGGGASVLVTDNNGTLNKTFAELKSATRPIFVVEDVVSDDGYSYRCYPVTKVAYDPDDGYYVQALTADGAVYYVGDSESDYPVLWNGN